MRIWSNIHWLYVSSAFQIGNIYLCYISGGLFLKTNISFVVQMFGFIYANSIIFVNGSYLDTNQKWSFFIRQKSKWGCIISTKHGIQNHKYTIPWNSRIQTYASFKKQINSLMEMVLPGTQSPWSRAINTKLVSKIVSQSKVLILFIHQLKQSIFNANLLLFISLSFKLSGNNDARSHYGLWISNKIHISTI